MEHLGRGQMDWGISPLAKKLEHLPRGQIDGVFHQGAKRLEHFAREQIDESRKNREPCEGANKWGHFARLQKKWSTLPGGR